MNTTYFRGHRVNLTGETEILHGATFHQGTYAEGPKEGQPVLVADRLAAAHLHTFLPEIDGNGLKTGVVSCDCGAWEPGGEDEGTYLDGDRIADEPIDPAEDYQIDAAGEW